MFWWVGEDPAAHEGLIGLYITNTFATVALVAIIEDNIKRMYIKLEHFGPAQ